jgi:hypothetical protein
LGRAERHYVYACLVRLSARQVRGNLGRNLKSSGLSTRRAGKAGGHSRSFFAPLRLGVRPSPLVESAILGRGAMPLEGQRLGSTEIGRT